MPRFRPLQHHSPRMWVGIAALGAAGSLLRWAITAEGGWLAIVVTNVLGCAVLGVLVARSMATPALAAGFCGGLTTFSGVAVQAQAAARGDGPGLLSAAGTDLVVHGLGGTLTVLASSALLGLAAFVAARRVVGGGPRARHMPPPPPNASAAEGLR